MELTVGQSKVSRLSSRLNLMVLLCLGLLVSNIMLAGISIYALHHQKTRYIPQMVKHAFVMSGSGVDASFLDQTSEALTTLLYNVTPENVQGNHQAVLTLIAPEHYSDFVKMLSADGKAIFHNKVSSIFYLTHIRSDPSNMTSEITGRLARHVGERALPIIKKDLVIHFVWQGRLLVSSITEKTKEAHDA